MPILLKLSIKQKGKEQLNSFYRASIAVILILNKDTHRKKNYRPNSLMNVNAKILKKKPCKQNLRTYLKDHTPGPSQFHSRGTRVVPYMQINKCNRAYIQQKK
jgi:hypothetical protein